MIASDTQAKATWLDGLAALLILGYLSMTRSFAHIGYSPVYVGEASLAAFLLAGRGAIVWPWLGAMFRPSIFSSVGWCLFFFMGYGVMQSWRGFAYGYSVSAVLQNVVIHLYPLFLFVGIGVGVRHPELLPKLIRVLAWWVGLYGTLYVLVLGQAGEPKDPTISTVSWFGQPHGAGVCLLGLLVFEKDLRRVWMPMLLDSFVFLAMQMRAAWVGLGAAILLWACLTGRVVQLAKLVAVAGVLLLVAALADLRYPAPACRSGEISVRHMLGRAIAVVDPESAEKLTGSAEDTKTYHGNASWRTVWWQAIWKTMHETPTRTAFGLSYGFPIWELHPLDDLRDPVRTPHNSYVYALGYTGWVGLALLCAWLLSLGGLLWVVYQRTGQAFGVCLWAMAMTWALFDGFFETPFSAIPFYLLAGLATAPVFTTTPEGCARLPSSPRCEAPGADS